MASAEISIRTPVARHNVNPIKNLPKPNCLSQLMQGLRCIFEDEHIDVDTVKTYMASYNSTKEDWGDRTLFDAHRYTRNLIDEGNGKFNLILLCWGQGHKSCIHDHANAHCFMKVLDGTLLETMYSWPGEHDGSPMLPRGSSSVEKNDVVYINDSIGLHRIENKSSTGPAVSLHLYCPPFQMCKVFDEKSGNSVKCNVTFHSKYDKKVCCRHLKKERN
ncbi:cysteine dioxygenase type 1-like [Clavelina lepadiformis]|uniref:cysteine dioxygenase type 1-like n=1 Tax=Clavelina lepadiformis TaxID=159417 RepID=UPI00404390AE